MSARITNLARAARQEVKESRKHIQLRNVPRTATPADIRRAVARNKLTGVSDVAIDYNKFQPSGRAYLTLTHPDYLRENLASLQKAVVGGVQVSVFPSPPPINIPPERTRGAKGRAEAANKGLLIGNGPQGGIRNSDCHVVIWGLPGRMKAERLRELLRDFELGGSESGEISQISKPVERFSLYSRFLVRLSSTSEAHRLVRQLHMSYFEPERTGDRYQLQARVVY